ncbi:MAG: hypothetical protein EZS28_040871, partial [Streblomastix strix]
QMVSQKVQLIFSRKTAASLALASFPSCYSRIRYLFSQMVQFTSSIMCRNLGLSSFLSNLGPIEQDHTQQMRPARLKKGG